MYNIKQNILTDENLRELVELTNEEIQNLSATIEEKIEAYSVQLSDVDSRLERLYDALETGKLKLDELAPRISSLVTRKKELQEAIAKIKNEKYEPTNTTDIGTLKVYVGGLREILGSAEVLRQKAFTKSFIKCIDVSKSNVTTHYTLPMPPSNEYIETVGFLGFKQSGGPFWTRTRDPSLIRTVL